MMGWIALCGKSLVDKVNYTNGDKMICKIPLELLIAFGCLWIATLALAHSCGYLACLKWARKTLFDSKSPNDYQPSKLEKEPQ